MGSAMKLVLGKYRQLFKLLRLKRIYCIFVGAVAALDGSSTTDPFRLELRHIESKGIGYPQGYTSLEAFYVSTEAWDGRWLPLLDVQGHLFNNGRAALNTGVGLRYINARVWGVSGYYDYRNTFRGHYHQVSLGLESLGKIWDFRLNIYHPFGKKVYKKEFSLQAFNGEAGLHVNTFKKAPLYFAAGPYYLNGEGRSIGGVWGGKIRAHVNMYNHVRLELSSSYDHLYQWIIQGQLGLFYLFGGKKEGRPRPPQTFQRIERHPIIPISQ
jgi:hypothetical protein